MKSVKSVKWPHTVFMGILRVFFFQKEAIRKTSIFGESDPTLKKREGGVGGGVIGSSNFNQTYQDLTP